MIKSSESAVIRLPTLYIHGADDVVITEKMLEPMKHLVPDLEVANVQSNHWTLLEKPDEVNHHLRKWLREHCV